MVSFGISGAEPSDSTDSGMAMFLGHTADRLKHLVHSNIWGIPYHRITAAR